MPMPTTLSLPESNCTRGSEEERGLKMLLATLKWESRLGTMDGIDVVCEVVDERPNRTIRN
jgi:hypothetical protein